MSLPHGDTRRSLMAFVPGGSCMSSFSKGLIKLTCGNRNLKPIMHTRSGKVINSKTCTWWCKLFFSSFFFFFWGSKRTLLSSACVCHPFPISFEQGPKFDKKHPYQKALHHLLPTHAVNVKSIVIKQMTCN